MRIRSRAIALPLSGTPSSARRQVEAARPDRELPAPACVVAVSSRESPVATKSTAAKRTTANGFQRAREPMQTGIDR